MSNLSASFSTSSGGVPTVAELPRKLQKSERKPFVTNVNELKQRARLERKIREEVHEVVLRPPKNGLLVKRLVPVPHEVYAARNVLFKCVSRIVESIAVHFCRLGRAVSHEVRLQVDRIPAIVELCIQAGVDILDYPTRRSTVPVYNIAGKIIDFELKFPRDDTSGKDIQAFGFWERRENTRDSNSEALPTDDMQEFIDETVTATVGRMETFLQFVTVRETVCRIRFGYMRHGSMEENAIWCNETHAVQTCGYCPEVQVWHLQYPSATLVDGLKRFYGKLPAAVELFAQAGAHVPEEYMSLMREDVAVPDLAEEKWVV
ncbi:hypothetical protein AAC387_Pa11g0259 [Persea americana]